MFLSWMAQLRFFPNSYAPTGNWTHASLVAPILEDLNPERFTDRAAAAATAPIIYAMAFQAPTLINLGSEL